MIPYKNYRLNEKQIQFIKSVNARRSIDRYIERNGVEPQNIEQYYTVTERQLESYRRIFYSHYYAREFADEEANNMVDIAMAFSAVEDQVRLGAGAVRGDGNYQYEYWNIAVLVYRDIAPGLTKVDEYAIGTFSSLENATIQLNTLKKYAICVYHRKSNYQPLFNVDNAFHNFTQYASNESIAIPEPRSDDKEYVGVIDEYSPQLGGTIRGSVYTLNPQLMVTVSGLTQGMSIDLVYGNAVRITRGENEVLTTDGDISCLTDNLDTSFSYLLTKEKLVNRITVTDILNLGQTNIQNPQHHICARGGNFAVGHALNGGTITMEGGNTMTLLRNGLSYENITIPPQTDVDTGFDFSPIDD